MCQPLFPLCNLRLKQVLVLTHVTANNGWCLIYRMLLAALNVAQRTDREAIALICYFCSDASSTITA